MVCLNMPEMESGTDRSVDISNPTRSRLMRRVVPGIVAVRIRHVAEAHHYLPLFAGTSGHGIGVHLDCVPWICSDFGALMLGIVVCRYPMKRC